MTQVFRPALSLVLFFTLFLGIGYPMLMTGVAQLVFPFQANGSLIRSGQAVLGSELIGQNFTSDAYFWPRPSATADSPYNAGASTGTNLGPTSAKLKSMVAAEIEKLKNVGTEFPPSADAVTFSGSGLDPEISPENARRQISRIAKARGLPEMRLKELVDGHIEQRYVGLFGEARVNVLALNLALDAEQPK